MVLDVPGSANDVSALYKSALPDSGWTTPTSPVYGGIGGFVSSSTPVLPTVYCRTADNASLTVTTRPTDGGPLDVRLAFDTGFAPQCSPPPTPPAYAPTFSPPGFGVIPSLQAPQGVSVYNLGSSGGGPNRFGTDSVAVTDMTVADLHAFYAKALTSAGWTQVSTGGGTSLIWSTWSIPDHSDLQGFLYVRDGPATGQRSLHLEVSSTDPNAVMTPNTYGYGVTLPGIAPAIAPATATPTALPTPGH